MLNTEDSLLVIIDIQEKLVNAVPDGKEIVSNFEKIAHCADILNIPTIVTEQYPKGLGQTVKDLKDSISEGTFTVEKTYFSAMRENDFKNGISSLGRKQIILGGIETHICVLQTAYDLIKEGYEVYILKDCTSSRNPSDNETGIELLKQYGAKVTRSEIAIFEWLKSSKNPHFKEIQTLIK